MHNAPKMEPAHWRKKAKLSLREVARKLGVASPNSVLRYESGEREAPNSIALAYERVSGGDVTGEDLNRVRKRHLRAAAAPAEVVTPAEPAAVPAPPVDSVT